MSTKKKSILISVFIPFRLTKNGLELWMQTRHEDGPLDGFLEFPGGKIEKGESLKNAAIREFCEEVEFKEDLLHLDRVVAFKNYSYDYPDRSVVLFTFIGQMPEKALSEDGWYKIDFSKPLDGIKDKILEANHELIKDLSHYFHGLVEDESWSDLWPPL